MIIGSFPRRFLPVRRVRCCDGLSKRESLLPEEAQAAIGRGVKSSFRVATAHR
jgi:hypothetical protein